MVSPVGSSHVVFGGIRNKLMPAAKRVRGHGAAELRGAVPGVRCPRYRGASVVEGAWREVAISWRKAERVPTASVGSA